MQKARSLSPQKTAAFIAEITGRPIRTVEYWLSTERLPGEAIGALIQSEEGFAFVEAIADASRPKWWRHVRRALALYDQQNNKFREAQNVATELVAALGQIAAGTSLQSAGLDRDEVDEIGNASAQARVLGRPVEKGRGR